MQQSPTFNKLLQTIRSYHPKADVKLIKDAYAYADMAFVNITRIDKSPLIDHALATAHILANIHVDEHTIAVSLLHDIIHETDLTFEDISEEFDEETLTLAQGISKLKTYTTKQSERVYAEQLRNLFLASTKDVRVVLIRLSEKIHNLQTVYALEPEKQRVVAQKAIDLYAPLAELIGVQKFRRELDDLAFKILQPIEYDVIKTYYDTHLGSHSEMTSHVIHKLDLLLSKQNIPHEIFGRVKHLYGTYNKFLTFNPNNLSLKDYIEQLYDKVAFTILTTSEDDCYRTLSTLKRELVSTNHPYKDYISNPKPNGYKAIHTYVYIRNNIGCEIQIKTRKMHEFNEFGPASHAYYKLIGRKHGSQSKTPTQKMEQIRELITWKENILHEKSDVTKLKTFDNRIYVFTPKADVIELPRGSTPIDFAYRIHTNVGNSMRGAYVNKKFVGIDHLLQNGDVCEILTHNGKKKPSPDWLRIVKTASARNQIRKSLS